MENKQNSTNFDIDRALRSQRLNPMSQNVREKLHLLFSIGGLKIQLKAKNVHAVCCWRLLKTVI